ncbi:MAG: hypothetical protein R6X12_06385 [bacterium]
MSRCVQTESGRSALFLLVGMMLVMMVIAAGVVVVRGARRIAPVDVPLHLQSQPPDVGLRRFRAGTTRRLARLEDRYERFRVRVTEPTVEQDSLAGVIAAELDGIRAGLAETETITDQRELNRRRGPLFSRYKALVNTVSRYVRTILKSEGPELDSLDLEIERLLRDDLQDQG